MVVPASALHPGPCCSPLIRSLAVALSAASFLGCGAVGKRDSGAPNRPIQQERLDAAFADSYQVEDLGCQSGADPVALGTVTLRRFEDGAAKDVAVDLSTAASAESLRGAGIMGSIYNFYQTTRCAVGDQGVLSCGLPSTVQPGQNLRICRPSGPYGRSSVEAISLVSLSHLEFASSYYQRVAGHRGDIAPATLIVLPVVEKTSSDGRRSVSTDNLAYVPNFGGTPAFVVFPKGQAAKAKGLWLDVNFWEIPWTLAHEFGHHVFQTHTGIATSADSRLGAGRILPIQAYEDDGDPDVQGGVRLTGATTADDDWDAVNEAYADLFAYFAFARQARLSRNVDCFDKSRDISEAEFGSGAKKVLTSDALTSFRGFGTKPSSCAAPNFLDVHTIGAIIARTIDQVFTQSAGAKGLSGQVLADYEATLLLRWAEAIGREAKAKGRENLGMAALLRLGLAVAADSGRLTAESCQAAKDGLPALKDKLFAADVGYLCP